ncbi:hypothetical protein [Aureimonas glaciei]|jgi:hypothetical protein|uniref:Uncharacterized protein n=1 Tax=Aureimonas glaciei TaxID=1776957 RepID=A0A916Y2U8_9HYPH|nr:hypothetical protein [Aureimonas glaciei]GGD28450.1 hypothetical protein GCM10011335_34560 [Aureimonas glaciei]
MKKIILAAGLSLMSTVAFAQTTTQGTTGANEAMGTSPNGVDSTTVNGQGTGAGTDANGNIIPMQNGMASDDNMTTGSMTTDGGAADKKDAPLTGANVSSGTAPGGVDSATTTGQGTGSGTSTAQ